MGLRSFEGAGPSLVDSLGRVHRSLRISVTDHCNLRCFYCMPAGEVSFAPREELLTFPEIARVAGLLARVGVCNMRISGGEPLLRGQLDSLVEMLAGIDGIADLALTTNGVLLPQFAQRLRAAGLRRVNISLDTLDETVFRRITRRGGVQRVIRGIDAALEAGFEQVRLNALAITGLTESELQSLVEFAVVRGLTIRFIEYMPLDAARAWTAEQVLSGESILERLRTCFGRLREVAPPQASQPARDYELLDLPVGAAGTRPRVGLIRPVTQPFCQACDRLRLTAEGMLRNCLFSDQEWDLRGPLRSGASDAAILEVIAAAVAAKGAGHLINRLGFSQPERPMYRIGG